VPKINEIHPRHRYLIEKFNIAERERERERERESVYFLLEEFKQPPLSLLVLWYRLLLIPSS
jgi:hypothetical protein